MNRRKFINAGSLTGLSLISLSVVSCGKNNSKTENARTIVKAFELHEVTIETLQQKMQSGALSSKSITQLYLDRIDQNNKKGAAINAVIEVNPDAIAIAESLDSERKNGKIRGPLHGIPILIKDNIDTADKMQTTAGSIALEGNIAKKDSFIVTQLRNAGAVILGKTNLSEFANFRSTRSVSGRSSRGGQTKKSLCA